MDVDGSNPVRLTNSVGEDAHLMWSPDGSQIVFHSRRTGNLDVFIMNSDGTGVTQVTDTGAFEFFPVWSPDGTKISFTGNTLASDRMDVYVMDVDGSDIIRVTSNEGFDGRCDWGRNSPTARSDCQGEGWRDFNSPTHERFRNRGECFAFVASGGKSERAMTDRG